MMRSLPRTFRRQGGAAIVELALVLPMLLVVTFIVTEFGRAIHEYNVITKSVRDAARFLSAQAEGQGVSAARNLVVYGAPGGGQQALLPGLSPAHVPDPVWQTSGTNPVIKTVTVRVSGYTFRSLFGSAFGVTFGDIIYNDISATMRAPL